MSQARRRQVREGATKGARHGGPGLVAGLRMLARSALFVKLTACVMLTGIVMEGMYNLLGQYFQLKLEYTVQDQVGRVLKLIIAGVQTYTVIGFDLHAWATELAVVGPLSCEWCMMSLLYSRHARAGAEFDRDK